MKQGAGMRIRLDGTIHTLSAIITNAKREVMDGAVRYRTYDQSEAGKKELPGVVGGTALVVS